MTAPRGIGKGRGSRQNTTTLKIAKLDKVIQRTNELKGTTITVGFDSSSGRHPYNNIPYATIANWMEFGTNNGAQSMQARPFMSWTFESEIYQAEIKAHLTNIVLKAFRGGNFKGDLNALGKTITKAIQATMVYMSSAFPNRPSWAEQKGHDSSFFWTGGLYDSVMYKVSTQALSAKQRRRK